MVIFALKLLLVPVLVAALSVAMTRFGPTVAGLLAGLPSIGAPIFAFLVFEHGTAFGVQAATSTLVGMISTAAFAVCYAWTCRSLPWYGSVLAGWLAFAVVTMVMNSLTIPLGVACLIGLSIPLATVFFPRVTALPPRTPLPRSEIALRMIAAAAMVFATTELAARAGPKLAGLFLPFPIAATVLAAFSHRLHGVSATVPLLKGIVGGACGYAAFFIVAAYALQGLGLWATIALALLGSLIVQGSIYQLFRLRQRRRLARA